MSSRLSPSTRQERLEEVKGFVLRLLDQDKYPPWQIKTECEHYVRSRWVLNKETTKDYVECTLQLTEIRDMIVQQDRRKVQKTSL